MARSRGVGSCSPGSELLLLSKSHVQFQRGGGGLKGGMENQGVEFPAA